MKKIILISALMLFVAVSFSQRTTITSYADTLSGADTKYYAAPAFSELQYGAFGIYVDHLTGSADSTYVSIQGSIDGTTYQTLGSTSYTGAALYTNTITVTAGAPTDFTPCRFYTTDAGMIWNITNALKLPYYRFKVQHWVTGTVSVKAWMYKKR